MGGAALAESLVIFADTFAFPPTGIVTHGRVSEYGSSSPLAASLELDENHAGSCQRGSR
jgi:hypothetical protein